MGVPSEHVAADLLSEALGRSTKLGLAGIGRMRATNRVAAVLLAAASLITSSAAISSPIAVTFVRPAGNPEDFAGMTVDPVTGSRIN